jgi:mono/diheme cytochrome c family protein
MEGVMTSIAARRLGATVAFLVLFGAGVSSYSGAPARAAGDEFDAATYFKAKCMMCHTATAKKHFDPAKADDELVKIVLKGAKSDDSANMPAYEAKGVTEDQAKALVAHMRSVKQ